MAYWRFEDRPLGAVVPHTMQNKRSVRATLDSSFNGNDLFAYSESSHPSFSRDVPAATVPSTGEPNLACLDSSEPLRPGGTRNLYTHSAFSHAAPLDLQSIEPREWTIEASVKPAALQCKPQTFVGRDGNEPGAAVVVPTRLAFYINKQNRFMIRFVVSSISAIASREAFRAARAAKGRSIIPRTSSKSAIIFRFASSAVARGFAAPGAGLQTTVPIPWRGSKQAHQFQGTNGVSH